MDILLVLRGDHSRALIYRVFSSFWTPYTPLPGAAENDLEMSLWVTTWKTSVQLSGISAFIFSASKKELLLVTTSPRKILGLYDKGVAIAWIWRSLHNWPALKSPWWGWRERAQSDRACTRPGVDSWLFLIPWAPSKRLIQHIEQGLDVEYWSRGGFPSKRRKTIFMRSHECCRGPLGMSVYSLRICIPPRVWGYWGAGCSLITAHNPTCQSSIGTSWT